MSQRREVAGEDCKSSSHILADVSSFLFCSVPCRGSSRNRSDSSSSSSLSVSAHAQSPVTACAPVCCADEESNASDSGIDESPCCFPTPCAAAKFHFVPRTGWHPHLKEMGCDARNTLKWKGQGPVPEAPEDCWMLPTSDEMALCIAQLRTQLSASGWKLLTCEPHIVSGLSNKAALQATGRKLGLTASLPVSYAHPDVARYPCILKAAVGQHGKDVFIVNSKEESEDITTEGFGSKWVLQELIPGRMEYSASLLVNDGVILDAVLTEYEYSKDVYVWPHDVVEVCRQSHSDIPERHLATMTGFLREYSGICNFNYKVRASGDMCIFEVNTRVGADLACDVPRDRARALFEKLDELSEKLTQRLPSSPSTAKPARGPRKRGASVC
mmetsp:Transcript_30669/g.77491  ORF Transcript_30669/g.77491 Transcript_30669/m.77491 type:complete len:385 (-) Transcript_30669:57-1211(-)